MHTSSLWKIYCDSFPEDERRSMLQQQIVQQNPLYHLELIHHENSVVGFKAWWDLESCAFIEHLAVDAAYRSYGLGGKFLSQFLEHASKPVILEVEPSEGSDSCSAELKQRRIGFYERLGFKLNTYEYYQPSFKDDGWHVPLMVMSYPIALPQCEFEQTAQSLYTHVYGRPGNPLAIIATLRQELERL